MVFSGTKTAAMNRVALCITAAIFHARNAMQPNTPPNMGIQKMSDEQTYPAEALEHRRVAFEEGIKRIAVERFGYRGRT